MIIRNGVLLSVNASDVDARGVLRIPRSVTSINAHVGDNLPGLRYVFLPDSITEITAPIFNNNPELTTVRFGRKLTKMCTTAFARCPALEHIILPDVPKVISTWSVFAVKNLKSVSFMNSRNRISTYPISQYFGSFYHVGDTKQIGKYTVRKLYRLNFGDNVKNILNEKPYFGISHKQRTFVRPALNDVVCDWRKYILSQEFERAMWEYKAKNPKMEFASSLDWESVLRSAMTREMERWYTVNVARRNMAREWVANLDKYITALCEISEKYPKTGRKFYELESLTMSDLLKIIAPAATGAPVEKTCTRWLTRHPVNTAEMHAIVMAGYKNPGAFPATWLRRIEPSARGVATGELHNVLRNMAIKLYSPSDENATAAELRKLSRDISRVIHQPIQAKYLGAGDFAKTYTLQIPGDKKYVWKIYHCDRTHSLLNKYQHNTELQNSFLMGGRRYSGNTKFRKISTAGISNQRGEVYLIYPYTDAEPAMRRVIKSFGRVEKYVLTDINSENFRGRTIIDMGALRINYNMWSQPRFVSKIIRTVLYHSWNDLGYVLNNYNSKQIATALSFISGKISYGDLNYELICDKIKYLKQNAKIR